MKIAYIKTTDELNALIIESERGALRPGENPCKKQSFYIFRGVSSHTHDLESSLARYAKRICLKGGLDWRTLIQEAERGFLERFTKEVVPSPHFLVQYGWWKDAIKNIHSDTYRIMSIMQHYSAPTRLVDFSSDFMSALFFASRHPGPEASPAIYRFSAVNDDCNDENGNKSPKDLDGNPFKERGKTQYNANTFLGRIAGFSPYAGNPINLDTDPLWKNPRQSIGWDTPEYRNPRLARQDGYFVYNVDCRKTLHEDALQTDAFEKYIIANSLLQEIQARLIKEKRDATSMYADLDFTFEDWTRNEAR